MGGLISLVLSLDSLSFHVILWLVQLSILFFGTRTRICRCSPFCLVGLFWVLRENWLSLDLNLINTTSALVINFCLRLIYISSGWSGTEVFVVALSVSPRHKPRVDVFCIHLVFAWSGTKLFVVALSVSPGHKPRVDVFYVHLVLFQLLVFPSCNPSLFISPCSDTFLFFRLLQQLILSVTLQQNACESGL